MTPHAGRAVRGALIALMAIAGSACGRQAGGAEAASPPPAAAAAADIKHLNPVPDSVGAQPTRFEWTAVPQAESYTLRVWNEADVRVISETGLTSTAIDFPAEYQMPAGTYFWAIVGMQGNQPVAESGLAAFVVRQP